MFIIESFIVIIVKVGGQEDTWKEWKIWGLFWVGRHGDGYKNALPFLIDIYTVINFTILLKLIQIKNEMPDESIRPENNRQRPSSVETNVGACIWFVSNEMIRSSTAEP